VAMVLGILTGRRGRACAAHLALAVVTVVGPLVMPGAQPQGVMAHTTGKTPTMYRNPVFARDFPDPDVIKVGRAYYAYATATAWEARGHIFPILRSRDLVRWQYVGDAMPGSPAWSNGNYWAPGVVEHNGTFYMYYVGKDLRLDRNCVAVATAGRPIGPFTHRAVLGCGDAGTAGYIDPQPFIDTAGRAYLYFKKDNPVHIISVVQLRPDLLHATGPIKDLLKLDQTWEFGSYSTVEAPFAIKHGRTYVLFYSGNNWEDNYAEGYATSASPLGPFKKYAHNPILRSKGSVRGPGGASLVEGPHGGWWMVYHAWSGGPGYDAGGVRTLRIDPISWRGNTISVRGPTTGLAPAP
jgi:beta-xylosidase